MTNTQTNTIEEPTINNHNIEIGSADDVVHVTVDGPEDAGEALQVSIVEKVAEEAGPLAVESQVDSIPEDIDQN